MLSKVSVSADQEAVLHRRDDLYDKCLDSRQVDAVQRETKQNFGGRVGDLMRKRDRDRLDRFRTVDLVVWTSHREDPCQDRTCRDSLAKSVERIRTDHDRMNVCVQDVSWKAGRRVCDTVCDDGDALKWLWLHSKKVQVPNTRYSFTTLHRYL